jgi:hypothetical protein
MIRCIRTTLTLDDDVAAMLLRVQKKTDATLQNVVNNALRRGLEQMSQPAPAKPRFMTHPVSLGRCYFPNLDNTGEVLADAEGESHK